MLGEINFWAILTTGLFAGGLTCMAVQGGLLTAVIASREKEKILDKQLADSKLLPITSFLIAKIAAYTILGAILGWIGNILQLSIPVQAGLQALVGIYMLGIALNMLNIHPFFRYFILQPPKFLFRIIRNQSKKSLTAAQKDIYAPAFMGAFTIFIPCGVTQAMMALAIAAANPLLGALVMFVFTVGTSPAFALLGYATIKLGDFLKKGFSKIAASAIIILAIFTLNNAAALTGTDWTLQNMLAKAVCVFAYCGGDSTSSASTAVSEQTITFNENGYSPSKFTVQKGSVITLHLDNKNAGGCVQAFTIPSLNIQKIVPMNTKETITFKAPDKQGQISFMCSMGMYAGTIEVI